MECTFYVDTYVAYTYTRVRMYVYLYFQAQHHLSRARKVDDEERALREKLEEEKEALRVKQVEEQVCVLSTGYRVSVFMSSFCDFMFLCSTKCAKHSIFHVKQVDVKDGHN